MFTLTKASEETKEILKWGGLFLVGLFIFFVLLRMVLYVKDLFFPNPPPKPTVAFGKLPHQNFPANTTDAKLIYSLNTLTGNTPNLQNQAKVYALTQPQSDLLALSRTKDMVSSIGFKQEPRELSPRTFDWSTTDGKDIKIDIINHNFIFTYPYLSDPDVLSSTNLTASQAIETAKNMLSSMQLLSADTDLSKTKTISYSLSGGKLIPATSLASTQVIQVSFVQTDIDSLPVYYDNPNSSSMNFLVSTGKVINGNFLHQTLSTQSATYPIKTAGQAYEELQKGGGYIAFYGGSPNVAIKNIFLAYYMSGSLQNFLMPVFVFQGDNGFYAYIPAVTDVWTNK